MVSEKTVKTTRNKKKKLNKIVMLARSKLNSIVSKILEAYFSEILMMKKKVKY